MPDLAAALRPALFTGVLVGCGVTLLLAELRWFRRPGLAERLRPYRSAGAPTRPAGLVTFQSFRDVVGPLSHSIGSRIARLFGVSEDLAVRLQRAHAPVDATTFRVRQVGWAALACVMGAVAAVGTRPPVALVPLLVVGTPLLAFLVIEQQAARMSDRWQRRLLLELPVVSEQLATLLGAGYSLGAALHRLATRGRGASGRDLGRVCARVRHGVSEADALREWAALARVPAVDRLVAVLALNRETTELGRLVSAEARAIRRDVHRELLETIARRGQQVWVPVTVATLVPGVIFLAIPFIEALRVFSGS